MSKLTFDMLREANRRRLPQFKNAHGYPAHCADDGSDWERSDWLEALVGEIGEYANFSKKFRRGDLSEQEFLKYAKKELADAQCYLDLLALRLGVNLGEAVIEKFNEVSIRVESDVFLPLEDMNE